MSPDPDAPAAATVTSLVDRIAPAQRARQLATAAAKLAELIALIEEHPKHAAHALAIRSAFGAYRGDFDGALTDVQRLIEREPGVADGYSRRGDLLLRQRRTAEARSNFLRALRLDPDDLRACAGMGQSHLREEAWQAAQPLDSRAIRIAPQAASLRIERALCFENLRRLDEAVADHTLSLALEPDDVAALESGVR